MFDAATVEKLTTGTAAGWTLVLVVCGWIIKTWPAWKAKVNEARKIEVDAAATIREHLIERISALEHDLSSERRRCDEELRALRDKLDGVVRQFLAFQMAAAQAIPPARRSPAIDDALDQLRQHLSPPGDKP
jgi:hypothetical protein